MTGKCPNKFFIAFSHKNAAYNIYARRFGNCSSKIDLFSSSYKMTLNAESQSYDYLFISNSQH